MKHVGRGAEREGSPEVGTENRSKALFLSRPAHDGPAVRRHHVLGHLQDPGRRELGLLARPEVAPEEVGGPPREAGAFREDGVRRIAGENVARGMRQTLPE